MIPSIADRNLLNVVLENPKDYKQDDAFYSSRYKKSMILSLYRDKK